MFSHSKWKGKQANKTGMNPALGNEDETQLWKYEIILKVMQPLKVHVEGSQSDWRNNPSLFHSSISPVREIGPAYLGQ